MTSLKILSLMLLCGAAVSCSTVSSSVADLKSIDLKKKLGLKETPPLVEVDPESFKKTLTADEKLIAWNRSKQKTSQITKLKKPADFDPGSLPSTTPSQEIDTPSFGLLPPLRPGGRSGFDLEEGITGLDTLPPVPENLKKEEKETEEEEGGFFQTS